MNTFPDIFDKRPYMEKVPSMKDKRANWHVLEMTFLFAMHMWQPNIRKVVNILSSYLVGHNTGQLYYRGRLRNDKIAEKAWTSQ